MAAAVLLTMRGRDLAAVSVTPQTVGSGGALTPGTTITLDPKLIKNIMVEIQAEDEELGGTAMTWQHNVTISDGVHTTIELIKQPGDSVLTPTNKLLPAFISYDYFSISFQRAGVVFTVAGKRGTINEGVQGRGVQTQNATFVPAYFGDTDTFKVVAAS